MFVLQLCHTRRVFKIWHLDETHRLIKMFVYSSNSFSISAAFNKRKSSWHEVTVISYSWVYAHADEWWSSATIARFIGLVILLKTYILVRTVVLFMAASYGTGGALWRRSCALMEPRGLGATSGNANVSAAAAYANYCTPPEHQCSCPCLLGCSDVNVPTAIKRIPHDVRSNAWKCKTVRDRSIDHAA